MKLFTIKQAASELGVSSTLLYALVSRRRIRHERHGLGRGTIRIPEDAIEEYRRARAVGVVQEQKRADRPRVKLKHLRLS